MVWLRSLLLCIIVTLLVAGSDVAAGARPTRVVQMDINQVWLPLVMGQPAPSVRVLSQRSAGLGTSGVVVVGEVLNELAVPVYLVNVTARFYDAVGQQVATASVLTALIQTRPGQRNPFRLVFSPAPTVAARYDLSLTWSFQNRSAYRPITLLAPRVSNDGSTTIDGLVRNDQVPTLRTGKVVATFYAADGTVVDTAASSIGKTFLDSGDRYPFIIRTDRLISFDQLVLQAEGYVKP